MLQLPFYSSSPRGLFLKLNAEWLCSFKGGKFNTLSSLEGALFGMHLIFQSYSLNCNLNLDIFHLLSFNICAFFVTFNLVTLTPHFVLYKSLIDNSYLPIEQIYLLKHERLSLFTKGV